MKQSIFLIMFLMGLLNVGHNFAQTSKRPNILVIFSDDHTNQSISAYGSKLMQTPNIDKIAKEGAIFKHTFVTNSICAPSRAVLLTGKYSHINGLIHQFYTNISSLNETGNESVVFTLSVNHPFLKNNVIWYQTDWDIIGLKCKLNDLLLYNLFRSGARV